MTTTRYKAALRPIVRPLICPRGDTLAGPVMRHWNPDRTVRRNLTGCTITLIATLADGTTVDLSAYLVRDDLNGQYRPVIPVSVTNGATPWPQGLGTYAIAITDTAGIVATYWTGKIGLTEVGS